MRHHADANVESFSSMANVKNGFKTKAPSRKTRTSKTKIRPFVFLCFVLLVLVIVVACYFVFVNNEKSKNAIFEKQIKDGEALISDDEMLYGNSINKDRKEKLNSAGTIVDENNASPQDKANFRAPEYRKKDKDYLDKLIQTR